MGRLPLGRAKESSARSCFHLPMRPRPQLLLVFFSLIQFAPSAPAFSEAIQDGRNLLVERQQKMWEEHQRTSPIVRSFMRAFVSAGKEMSGKSYLSLAFQQAAQGKTDAASSHLSEHRKSHPESGSQIGVTYSDVLSDASELLSTMETYCSSFYASRADDAGRVEDESKRHAALASELRRKLVLHTSEQAVFVLDRQLEQDLQMKRAANSTAWNKDEAVFNLSN